MTTFGYLIAQDLVDAISEPTYMSIFDDTNSGDRATVDVSSGVISLMRRAHARSAAILPRLYQVFPPDTAPAGIPTDADNIPILMKDLEVQLLVIYACQRHPELMKTYGITPSTMKDWKDFAKDIAEASLIFLPSDSPPQPAPANVGGVIDSGASGQNGTVANAPPPRTFADGMDDF